MTEEASQEILHNHVLVSCAARPGQSWTNRAANASRERIKTITVRGDILRIWFHSDRIVEIKGDWLYETQPCKDPNCTWMTEDYV